MVLSVPCSLNLSRLVLSKPSKVKDRLIPTYRAMSTIMHNKVLVAVFDDVVGEEIADVVELHQRTGVLFVEPVAVLQTLP